MHLLMNGKHEEGNMSTWILIAILAALFLLFWLIFGSGALKYLLA